MIDAESYMVMQWRLRYQDLDQIPPYVIYQDVGSGPNTVLINTSSAMGIDPFNKKQARLDKDSDYYIVHPAEVGYIASLGDIFYENEWFQPFVQIHRDYRGYLWNQILEKHLKASDNPRYRISQDITLSVYEDAISKDLHLVIANFLEGGAGKPHYLSRDESCHRPLVVGTWVKGQYTIFEDVLSTLDTLLWWELERAIAKAGDNES